METAPSKETLPMNKFKIMVVDDYADAAESLAFVLLSDGHNVEIAYCGIKAIELAKVFQPRIALIDIGLPDLDGYQVANQLRTFPETKNTILIAVTGYGQDKDRERAYAEGFDHHMLKPVDFEKLSALIQNWGGGAI
ncbi:MAG: response regulator [Methylomonas sp.]|jgi:CheY-like chemotaxis protein